MTARMRKILWSSGRAVLAAAVVLAAMAWLSGVFRGHRIAPGKAPLATDREISPSGQFVPVVKVARPRPADIVGSVQAELRTTVSARLVANIVQMKVRSGDAVKKGDVLVVLDDRDLKARLGQATEALRAAEAPRDLAKIEVDRLTRMAAQKVATEYEVDLWKSKHTQALADVARAQQAISEAEVALSDTQILAPFDGIVIDRQAEPGDLASPGRALLAIYDPSRLRLEASAREAYIGYLQSKKETGQEVPVVIEALKREGGEQRLGKVQEIVPAADPASRSFLVKVHLTDPKGLYPGMFGRMRVLLDAEERLEIPLAAVEQIGQLSLVQVSVDGQPQRRSVRLGQVDGQRVEVLAGLNETEQVLVKATP